MSQAIFFGLATFKLLFEKFDVLDVDHMPFFPLFSARVVTWLKGKKMYATWHEVWGRSYWFEYLKGPAGFLGYIIEQASFFLPDVIISNSEHTTALLRQAGVKQEIKTVPLGVDLENVYAAVPSREKSDIIFVGRFLSHKNADLLIRAVGMLNHLYPHITCKIIGDGPEKENLKTLIGELELQDNVQILDAIASHSILYGLMKSSKMLVLPSVREGFGLVAVEAFAAGIPVITTRHKNNAAKDLILEGINGFLTEPTARDIADKIKKVLQSKDKLDPQREIEQYDWQMVANRMEKILV